MSINKLKLTFGAAVALVILIDLATGQGPPIYTNYLAAQQNYPQQPPPPPPPAAIQLQPVGYPHRAEYESKNKEYEKAIELGKAESGGKHHKFAKKHGDKSEYEKLENNKAEGEYDYDSKSTPAPGVLSSLSNSMSGAWSRISTLGRSKRGADENKDTPAAATAPNATIGQGSGDSTSSADVGKSQSRGMDSYELLHQKSNGYIYFKVPKHLVCNY